MKLTSLEAYGNLLIGQKFSRSIPEPEDPLNLLIASYPTSFVALRSHLDYGKEMNFSLDL